jgi:hypothetical protein
MIQGKKVVFYELNEVPVKILVDYTEENPNSALAQVLHHGVFYKTIAEDKGHLSPWITWPTLHRGVTNEKHLIQNFGQDLSEVNKEYPAYTELLSRQGVKVGVFGSLHTYPLLEQIERYAFYVPDTFANGPECFPDSLTCFQDFNLKMVDSSGRNVSKGLNLKAALPFLAKAPSLGIQADTVYRLAKQIVDEKTTPSRIGRRRTSQMQLAFDLFIKQLHQHKPDLSTFFTNHVASSMHRYWPAKYPHDFQDLELTSEWYHTYCGEIDFTMEEADRQLSKILSFVKNNKDYVLVIASSMGQAAVDRSTAVRTQLLINDLGKFMESIGVSRARWQPRRAMVPMYMVFIDGDVIDLARQNLSKLHINNAPIDFLDLGNNIFQIFFQLENPDETQLNISLNGQTKSLDEMGLAITVIEDESGSYAYHIPEGILLIFDPNQSRAEDRGVIPTTAIAPAMLANFNVQPPAYMIKSQMAQERL